MDVHYVEVARLSICRMVNKPDKDLFVLPIGITISAQK